MSLLEPFIERSWWPHLLLTKFRNSFLFCISWQQILHIVKTFLGVFQLQQNQTFFKVVCLNFFNILPFNKKTLLCVYCRLTTGSKEERNSQQSVLHYHHLCLVKGAFIKCGSNKKKPIKFFWKTQVTLVREKKEGLNLCLTFACSWPF